MPSGRVTLYSKDWLKMAGWGGVGVTTGTAVPSLTVSMCVQQLRGEQDYCEECPTEVFINLNESLRRSCKRWGKGEDEVGSWILLTSIHLPESTSTGCLSGRGT